MTTTMKSQTEIQSPALYRVKDKATRETFYLVQSDSQAHTFYEVRFDNSALIWRCNCVARPTRCKHQRAVCEVLKLRRLAMEVLRKDMPTSAARSAFDAEQAFQAYDQACNDDAARYAAEKAQREEAAYNARRMEQASREALPLHSANRPFSLLK